MRQSLDSSKTFSASPASQVQHLLRTGRLLTLRHVYLMQSKPRRPDLSDLTSSFAEEFSQRKEAGEDLARPGTHARLRIKSEGNRQKTRPGTERRRRASPGLDLRRTLGDVGKITAPLSRQRIPSGFVNCRRRVSATRLTLEGVLACRGNTSTTIRH